MMFQEKQMNDEMGMQVAVLEAKKAFKKNEVPVGAIIVVNNKVVCKSHNKRQFSKNAIRHAEVDVIEKACKKLKRRILDDATLYVTLEPCLMCAGAIVQARIGRVVYGAAEPKFGVLTSLGNIFNDYKLNHKPIVVGGILEEETKTLMQSFFKQVRENKK